MDSALGPLASFVVVIALIPVLLWLLKRTPMGGAGQGHGGRVIGVLPLANAQRVVTVEVGHGADRRWLVLGITAQSITTLHVMPPQAETPPATSQAPFGDLMARLRGPKDAPRE